MAEASHGFLNSKFDTCVCPAGIINLVPLSVNSKMILLRVDLENVTPLLFLWIRMEWKSAFYVLWTYGSALSKSK